MKQNRLISIGTFILVLALSGLMTGCMEKDVYDPNREKEPLPDPDKYFGFEMRSDVRLSVNYDIYGFTPLIEIYGENPMETVEGTPIKKEGTTDLYLRCKGCACVCDCSGYHPSPAGNVRHYQ